jgi:hypothetical protein
MYQFIFDLMRIVKYPLLWCVCCLLFSGCSVSNQESLSTLFDGLHVDSKAETAKIHSSDITTPMYIECYKNLLICANFRGEKKIRVYDLMTGEIVTEFLGEGRGPEEIIHVSSMYLLKDTLRIYCNNSRKLISTPAKELFTPPAELTIASGFVDFLRVLPLDRGFFATTGFNELGYLQLIDKNGEIQVLEYFPDDRVSSLKREITLAYQGKLHGNPNGNKFVYGSSYGLILKFMELSDRSTKKQKEYIFGIPKYIPDSKPENESFSIQWENDALRGVLSMTGSDQYCFILCEENKKINDRDWSLSSVYVFTWDGVPVQKMNLDRPAECITYEASSQKLIALTHTDKGEYEFVFFPIRLKEDLYQE